jgi:enediyne biosynthesis protein E4
VRRSLGATGWLALALWLHGASVTAEGEDASWIDVSDEAGVTFRHVRGVSAEKYLPETMGAGVAVLDYDGDGWMDIYLVQSGDVAVGGGPPNRLLRNRGDGTFEDVTERAGVGDRGYGQGAVAADFDGDSDIDLYVTNLGPNVLLRNEGDGTFSDVTRAAGVGDGAWSTSATFFDLEGDGDLDLYVVNYVEFSVDDPVECRERRADVVYYCHPDVYPMAPDTVFRNRGDGTFEPATDEGGLTDTVGKGLGVVAADLDLDGSTDLYVANDSTPNFLYRNLGGGRFEETGLVAGAAYNEEGLTEAGMGVDAGDVNGDGRLDLIVTNLSLETNSLYLRGETDYDDATRQSGLHGPSLMVLGFGVDLLDVDDDGDLDLFVANGDVNDNIELFNDALTWQQPAQVFLNDGAGHFTEVPASRLGDLATPRVGRGSASLDFDNDGRLDLVVSHNDDRARLYRNVSPPAGWLQIVQSAGPGTRAEVTSATGRQVGEAKTASGYASSSDPRLHFGLGGQQLEWIEVRWPQGRRQRFVGIPPSRFYHLAGGP